MADDADNYTLRLLRRLDQKIDKLDLKLTDLTDAVHRLEADVGALRGSVSALRHDVNVFANRWSDVEVRLRALEEDSPPRHA
jgi:outer membrane murein-binding lipoprotein Lpp